MTTETKQPLHLDAAQGASEDRKGDVHNRTSTANRNSQRSDAPKATGAAGSAGWQSGGAKVVKTLPWGEEIYVEIPLIKRSLNKFYARHGKNPEGREYLEFSKFGPRPDDENETYSQKLRLYNPLHWAMIKHHVEGNLSRSIGWNLAKAERDLEAQLLKEAEAAAK